MNKNKLYWTLQIGGWGALMLSTFVSMLMFIPFLPAFAINFFSVFVGLFISHIFRIYVKKKGWKNLTIPQLLPRVVLASLINGTLLGGFLLAAVITVFTIIAQSDPSIYDAAFGVPEIEGMTDELREQFKDAAVASFSPQKIIVFVVSFISSFALYFVSWSALYFAYQYLQKNREIEIEKWKLSASVKDAELSALKAQINPHFIFNSLNNIRSLVVEDSERARDSITHLSDLLRFSIQFDQFEKVSLEKEIEVVKDYLNLEAIQLEDRLKYKVELAKGTEHIQIPPMVVQTLVENAIKHSINERLDGGEIIIESKLSSDFIHIYVKNSGQMTTPSSSKNRRGIGITNSKERLRLLYGEHAKLTVENMNEHMVCATVRIPVYQEKT